MRTTAILVSMGATAGAMALVGWGLPGLDMAGPRPGTRIAQLLPQLEVSLLFLVGLPAWSQALAAERSPALRVALAATARGRRLAVLRIAGSRLAAVAAFALGGAVVWVPATLLTGGPSFADVLGSRLLLLAFALFAVGLGTWASARYPGVVPAAAAAVTVLGLMASAPLMLAPLLSVFGTHWSLVHAAVLVNPWVVAAGVSGLDLVHMQWVYALSPLGHVEVSYPGLATSMLVYGAAGALLLGAAVRALRRSRALLVLACAVLGVGMIAGEAAASAETAIARGVSYLAGRQQPDGSWEAHAGLTAVALLALLAPSAETSPEARAATARGLAYVERWARPDGGVYQEDIRHYTTAVALLAFVASGEPRYRDRILAARDYLVRLQAREENGFVPSHPLFGGTLVDQDKANLDATFFAMRALAESGLPADDPYWARAVRFVTRCQNLRTRNDQPWAGEDGGFVFAPGFSFAGGTASYGTMTYAGLSAYRDGALPREDPRVEAALGWVRARFTAAENPGLQKQTLYHSFFYLSHTLRRWAIDTWSDAGGRVRSWRHELVTSLLARQQPDGSWANTEDPRWLESRPVLATSFAVRALKESLEEPRR